MLLSLRALRVRAVPACAATLVALLAACVPPISFAQNADPARTPQRFVPRIVVPEARIPVAIARMAAETEIVGPVARTHVDLVLRNPNERVLEGELQFPLRSGQEITGFALEIDGEMRPAVGVEKAKGRQTFDDVTRVRVDPALLEATGGNNYKLRVYPLPPRGTRRVALEITERLPTVRSRGANGFVYELPLRFGQPIEQMSARVRVAGVSPTKVSAQLGAERLDVRAEDRNTSLVSLQRAPWRGASALQVRVPSTESREVVTTGAAGDQTYFHADLAWPVQTQARPAPSRVAIVWDASASGASRDHAREFALLDTWLRALGDVQIDLITVRDVAEATRRFDVRGGDWRALRTTLEATVYDGATRLGAAVVPPEAQAVLLFSDGLDNYGGTALAPPRVPLHAIVTGAGVDSRRLRYLAETSGGGYVDLSVVTADDAARALRTARTRVVGLRAEAATDLVASSDELASGRYEIAGRLTAPSATVEVELQDPDGRRRTQRLRVDAKPPTGKSEFASAFAPTRWATLQLATLEADADRNAAAIRRLGMRFALATRETSLIVLDSVADYARYEIEPPASLRADYERLRAKATNDEAQAKVAHRERTVKAFDAKLAWWNKPYPKDAPPAPAQAGKGVSDMASESRAMPTGAAPPAPAMAAPPPPAPAPGAPARAMAAEQAGSSGASGSSAASGASQAAPAATIALRKWEPDAPYARRLRAAAPEAMYAIYLDERPAYTSSTAFYLDAADVFIDRGQRELGLRILSNLAEMDLENRQILRILAYRLVQAGAVETAIPLLRKIQRLSPDEPQSWRDLALALAAAGQRQEAVDLLWHVADHVWAPRFPDIELIALAEMNALIATPKSDAAPLNTSAIDERLRKNMPLDLRVVLTWDADNTDIDLHVIDPNGQEVYYGQPLSYQGGRVSRDFTGGYGPEEFALRNAKPGVYTVKAKFYGHRQQIVAPATTLMLWLSTGFGLAGQKDQSTVLRLSGTGDLVTVGTFTVAAP